MLFFPYHARLTARYISLTVVRGAQATAWFSRVRFPHTLLTHRKETSHELKHGKMAGRGGAHPSTAAANAVGDSRRDLYLLRVGGGM